MNLFEHDYYHVPAKKGEPATVLCMRCALKLKGAGLTKEDVKERYRERPVSWVSGDGARRTGVLILCPLCVDLEIMHEEFTLIHRQIMKALEDEAKWANIPFDNDLKSMTITNQEAA